MPRNVKPIPDGFHSITPYLLVEDASGLIIFLQQAFGAAELFRMPSPDGSIMHAEVKIGDCRVMLCDARGEMRPTTAMLYLYVDDVDTTFRRALEAGGRPLMELADQFWGDRSGSLTDPAGNVWWLATHIEDVTPEEMRRREQEWTKRRVEEMASSGAKK